MAELASLYNLRSTCYCFFSMEYPKKSLLRILFLLTDVEKSWRVVKTFNSLGNSRFVIFVAYQIPSVIHRTHRSIRSIFSNFRQTKGKCFANKYFCFRQIKQTKLLYIFTVVIWRSFRENNVLVRNKLISRNFSYLHIFFHPLHFVWLWYHSITNTIRAQSKVS